MRKLLVLLFLSIQTVLNAQNSFRLDYSKFATYEDGKWTSIQRGNHTFVFNSDSNSDIKWYNSIGVKASYRRISGTSTSSIDGYTYQITKFIDSAGNEAYIQLFDNVGWLVLIYPSLDFKIQFYP
jgi:hypothetical protein